VGCFCALLTLSCSQRGFWDSLAEQSQESSNIKIADVYFVHGKGNDATADGSSALPYLTVQAAVNAAVAKNAASAELRITGGTYQFASELTLPGKISLKGSYSPSTFMLGSYTTTLVGPAGVGGTQALPIATVKITSANSSAVSVENLTIQAPTGLATCALFVDGGAASIRNNILKAANPTIYAAALFANNAFSTIVDNTIEATFSVASTTAALSSSNSTLTVSNNTISIIAGGTTTSAVSLTGDQSTLNSNTITAEATLGYRAVAMRVSGTGNTFTATGNTINGGTGTYSQGLHYEIDSSGGQFIANTIKSGMATDSTNAISAAVAILGATDTSFRRNMIAAGTGKNTYGVHIGFEQASSTSLHNNVIEGGIASVNSHGIALYKGGTTTLYNNTINGGEGTGGNAFSIFIANGNPTLFMDNNILFHRKTLGYCVNQTQTATIPSFANNQLFNCGTALYRFNATNYALVAINDQVTLGSGFKNNVNAADPLKDLINGDYRLDIGASCDVLQGAKAFVAAFTIDIAETLRTTGINCGTTLGNASGWSIGAYEQD